MIKRIFKTVILFWLFLILVGLLAILSLPYWPIFKDEQISLTVTNSTSKVISIKMDILNLDSNKTESREIKRNLQPSEVFQKIIFLNGWTPETCEAILVIANAKVKKFDCGERKEINKKFETTTIINVGDF